ncbi:MAG TPA: Zn-ribbon domain-containing OB-fold protein [Candidatus Binataceae bacterium]|nr:Zn-ribbon domain-containing OB-fold protein [Candidatus Binataceae bacterium]
MSEQVLAQPGLYTADDAPKLNGGRCKKCDYVFFPPQTYGCESCGATPDQLEAVTLAGRGKLHSFATVHLHQDRSGKGLQAPFTVGLIVLDDGPAVRAILTERTDEGLRIGDRMHSVLAPAGLNDEGKQLVELRFAKMEAVR